MTEHEQLKYICDKIGYNISIKDGIIYRWETYVNFEVNNVREIIFTQEFINKFTTYYSNKNKKRGKRGLIFSEWTTTLLGWHLNNPTEYLYNLIK